MADRENVIRGLECCSKGADREPTWNNLTARNCGKCPYNKPGIACTRVLSYDALTLLKAQKPRVLTLEEVRQIGQRNMHHGKAPRETCVYERRGCIGLATCSPLWDEPQFEGDQSHLDIQYLFLGTDEYDVVSVKKYGFEIRCWHGCPTDEQREATPWE